MKDEKTLSCSTSKSKHGQSERVSAPKRFPRVHFAGNLTQEQVDDIWEGIPRLDLSKIRRSRWLIDFFLAEASMQLIYGSFGTRKTTITLLAAWAVSRGQRFLGRKTRRRCVLYLDYENPPDVLKSYCTDLGIDPSAPAFTIWDRSAGPPPVPNLKDSKLSEFVQRCKETTGRYPWIIFDSWTSLLKSGDSGDKIGEAAPIFQAIRRLCDKGATCTVIDHTGWSKGRPIGTSAKMTQMDTSHFFEAQKGNASLLDSNSSRTVIRVKGFLKRYAPENIGTFSIEVNARKDKKGAWHTTGVAPTKDISELKLESRIECLQELIERYPTLGQEELAEQAAKRKVMGSRSARQLLQDGIDKYWKTVPTGTRKRIFRVLKTKSQ